MRFVAILLLAAAPAVAQGPPVQTMTDGDAMLRAFSGKVLLDTLAQWQTVPLRNGPTFARVKKILDSLNIPYNRADSAKIIANTGFVARGKGLGGSANSKSLRCGFGHSGEYADAWRLTVAYAVYIEPAVDSPGTRLGVAVFGQAKDLAGASSPAVFCASRGRLESEIFRLVRETKSP